MSGKKDEEEQKTEVVESELFGDDQTDKTKYSSDEMLYNDSDKGSLLLSGDEVFTSEDEPAKNVSTKKPEKKEAAKPVAKESTNVAPKGTGKVVSDDEEQFGDDEDETEDEDDDDDLDYEDSSEDGKKGDKAENEESSSEYDLDDDDDDDDENPADFEEGDEDTETAAMEDEETTTTGYGQTLPSDERNLGLAPPASEVVEDFSDGKPSSKDVERPGTGVFVGQSPQQMASKLQNISANVEADGDQVFSLDPINEDVTTTTGGDESVTTTTDVVPRQRRESEGLNIVATDPSQRNKKRASVYGAPPVAMGSALDIEVSSDDQDDIFEEETDEGYIESDPEAQGQGTFTQYDGVELHSEGEFDSEYSYSSYEDSDVIDSSTTDPRLTSTFQGNELEKEPDYYNDRNARSITPTNIDDPLEIQRLIQKAKGAKHGVAVQKIGKLLDSVDPDLQKQLVEKTGLMDWAVSNKHLPLANFCQHVMLGENEDADSLLQHVLQYADEDNLGWLWRYYHLDIDIVFIKACEFGLLDFVKAHVLEVTPSKLCEALPVIMRRRRRKILQYIIPYVVCEIIPGRIIKAMIKERWWEGVLKVLDVIPVKHVTKAMRGRLVLNEENLRMVVEDGMKQDFMHLIVPEESKVYYNPLKDDNYSHKALQNTIVDVEYFWDDFAKVNLYGRFKGHIWADHLKPVGDSTHERRLLTFMCGFLNEIYPYFRRTLRCVAFLTHCGWSPATGCLEHVYPWNPPRQMEHVINPILVQSEICKAIRSNNLFHLRQILNWFVPHARKDFILENDLFKYGLIYGTPKICNYFFDDLQLPIPLPEVTLMDFANADNLSFLWDYSQRITNELMGEFQEILNEVVEDYGGEYPDLTKPTELITGFLVGDDVMQKIHEDSDPEYSNIFNFDRPELPDDRPNIITEDTATLFAIVEIEDEMDEMKKELIRQMGIPPPPDKDPSVKPMDAKLIDAMTDAPIFDQHRYDEHGPYRRTPSPDHFLMRESTPPPPPRKPEESYFPKDGVPNPAIDMHTPPEDHRSPNPYPPHPNPPKDPIKKFTPLPLHYVPETPPRRVPPVDIAPIPPIRPMDDQPKPSTKLTPFVGIAPVPDEKEPERPVLVAQMVPITVERPAEPTKLYAQRPFEIPGARIDINPELLMPAEQANFDIMPLYESDSSSTTTTETTEYIPKKKRRMKPTLHAQFSASTFQPADWEAPATLEQDYKEEPSEHLNFDEMIPITKLPVPETVQLTPKRKPTAEVTEVPTPRRMKSNISLIEPTLEDAQPPETHTEIYSIPKDVPDRPLPVAPPNAMDLGPQRKKPTFTFSETPKPKQPPIITKRMGSVETFEGPDEVISDVYEYSTPKALPDGKPSAFDPNAPRKPSITKSIIPVVRRQSTLSPIGHEQHDMGPLDPTMFSLSKHIDGVPDDDPEQILALAEPSDPAPPEKRIIHEVPSSGPKRKPSDNLYDYQGPTYEKRPSPHTSPRRRPKIAKEHPVPVQLIPGTHETSPKRGPGKPPKPVKKPIYSYHSTTITNRTVDDPPIQYRTVPAPEKAPDDERYKGFHDDGYKRPKPEEQKKKPKKVLRFHDFDTVYDVSDYEPYVEAEPPKKKPDDYLMFRGFNDEDKPETESEETEESSTPPSKPIAPPTKVHLVSKKPRRRPFVSEGPKPPKSTPKKKLGRGVDDEPDKKGPKLFSKPKNLPRRRVPNPVKILGKRSPGADPQPSPTVDYGFALPPTKPPILYAADIKRYEHEGEGEPVYTMEEDDDDVPQIFDEISFSMDPEKPKGSTPSPEPTPSPSPEPVEGPTPMRIGTGPKKPTISSPVVDDPEKKDAPKKKLGEKVDEAPAPTIDDPELYSTSKPIPETEEPVPEEKDEQDKPAPPKPMVLTTGPQKKPQITAPVVDEPEKKGTPKKKVGELVEEGPTPTLDDPELYSTGKEIPEKPEEEKPGAPTPMSLTTGPRKKPQITAPVVDDPEAKGVPKKKVGELVEEAPAPTLDDPELYSTGKGIPEKPEEEKPSAPTPMGLTTGPKKKPRISSPVVEEPEKKGIPKKKVGELVEEAPAPTIDDPELYSTGKAIPEKPEEETEEKPAAPTPMSLTTGPKKKPQITAPVVDKPEEKGIPKKKVGELVEEVPAPTIDDPELYSTGKPIPEKPEEEKPSAPTPMSLTTGPKKKPDISTPVIEEPEAKEIPKKKVGELVEEAPAPTIDDPELYSTGKPIPEKPEETEASPEPEEDKPAPPKPMTLTTGPKKKPQISAPVVEEPDKKETPKKKVGEFVEEGPTPTIDDPELYSTGKPIPKKDLGTPTVGTAEVPEQPEEEDERPAPQPLTIDPSKPKKKPAVILRDPEQKQPPSKTLGTGKYDKPDTKTNLYSTGKLPKKPETFAPEAPVLKNFVEKPKRKEEKPVLLNEYDETEDESSEPDYRRKKKKKSKKKKKKDKKKKKKKKKKYKEPVYRPIKEETSEDEEPETETETSEPPPRRRKKKKKRRKYVEPSSDEEPTETETETSEPPARIKIPKRRKKPKLQMTAPKVEETIQPTTNITSYENNLDNLDVELSGLGKDPIRERPSVTVDPDEPRYAPRKPLPPTPLATGKGKKRPSISIDEKDKRVIKKTPSKSKVGSQDIEDPYLDIEITGIGKPINKPLPPTPLDTTSKKRPYISVDESDKRVIKKTPSQTTFGSQDIDDPYLNTELYGVGKPIDKPLPPTPLNTTPGKKRSSISVNEKTPRKLKPSISSQFDTTEVEDPDLNVTKYSKGKEIHKPVLEQVQLADQKPSSTIEMLGVDSSDGTSERIGTKKRVGEGSDYNNSQLDDFKLYSTSKPIRDRRDARSDNIPKKMRRKKPKKKHKRYQTAGVPDQPKQFKDWKNRRSYHDPNIARPKNTRLAPERGKIYKKGHVRKASAVLDGARSILERQTLFEAYSSAKAQEDRGRRGKRAMGRKVPSKSRDRDASPGKRSRSRSMSMNAKKKKDDRRSSKNRIKSMAAVPLATLDEDHDPIYGTRSQTPQRFEKHKKLRRSKTLDTRALLGLPTPERKKKSKGGRRSLSTTRTEPTIKRDKFRKIGSIKDELSDDIAREEWMTGADRRDRAESKKYVSSLGRVKELGPMWEKWQPEPVNDGQRGRAKKPGKIGSPFLGEGRVPATKSQKALLAPAEQDGWEDELRELGLEDKIPKFREAGLTDPKYWKDLGEKDLRDMGGLTPEDMEKWSVKYTHLKIKKKIITAPKVEKKKDIPKKGKKVPKEDMYVLGVIEVEEEPSEPAKEEVEIEVIKTEKVISGTRKKKEKINLGNLRKSKSPKRKTKKKKKKLEESPSVSFDDIPVEKEKKEKKKPKKTKKKKIEEKIEKIEIPEQPKREKNFVDQPQTTTTTTTTTTKQQFAYEFGANQFVAPPVNLTPEMMEQLRAQLQYVPVATPVAAVAAGPIKRTYKPEELKKFHALIIERKGKVSRWKTWKKEEVAYWIHRNLDDLSPAYTFYLEEIDGSMLEDLTDEDLKELSLKMGHRKKYFRMLDDLKKNMRNPYQKFNVCGTHMEIAKDLIDRLPFGLYSFASSTESNRKGEYFVDRDPAIIGYILDYLRYGSYNRFIAKDIKWRLMKEAESLNLKSLASLIQDDFLTQPPVFQNVISINNQNINQGYAEDGMGGIHGASLKRSLSLGDPSKAPQALGSSQPLISSSKKPMGDGEFDMVPATEHKTKFTKRKRVNVNIGGKIFTISPKVYRQLINVIQGNEDSCFIDRDPALYEYIIDYCRCGAVNRYLPKDLKWRVWMEAEELGMDVLADEYREKPWLGPLDTTTTSADDRGTWSSVDHYWTTLFPMQGMQNYNPNQNNPTDFFTATIPEDRACVAFKFIVETEIGLVEYDYFIGICCGDRHWFVNCGLKTHYGHKLFLLLKDIKDLNMTDIQRGDPLKANMEGIEILQTQFLPTHGNLELQILVDRENRCLIFRNPHVNLEKSMAGFDNSSIIVKFDDKLDLKDLQAKVITVACVNENKNEPMKLKQKLVHCPLSIFEKYQKSVKMTHE